MKTVKHITLTPTCKISFSSNFTSIKKDLKLLEHVASEAKQTWSFKSVSFGHEYKYSGITHRYKPITEEMNVLARQIEKEFGYSEGYFNHIHANEFLTSSSGIGYHSDNEYIYKLKEGGYGDVAVLSYGGETTITVADKYRNDKVKLIVKSGSIYIMQGKEFQSNLFHKVGTVSKKRISITFRHISTK